MPTEYQLLQNYPNPFNPVTNIKYALPVETKVTIQIYNILGQRVRTLVSADQPAGYYVVQWNGTNDAGAQLASGVYFMRLSAEGNGRSANGGSASGVNFTQVKKLMIVK